MLAAMFISAVFEFGKIDLIGHTLIVVVLLAIVADNGGKRGTGALSVAVPVGLRLRAGAFLASYYVRTPLLFGTSLT